MILLDTNILIHSNQPDSPNFSAVTQRLIEMASNEEVLAVCPQVLYEYYAVVTRKQGENGYGMSPAEAMNKINNLINIYSFVEDPADLFAQWQQLVIKYSTNGKTSHDTRLVALMKAQGIDKIYTLNAADFNRYADIITILN